MNKKILVLGSTLPGESHGGGVVKDEVLSHLPNNSYVCFSLEKLSHDYSKENIESLKNVPILIKSLYPQPKWRGARLYLPIIRLFGFLIISRIRVIQIVKFAKKNKINLIWAELQGDSIVLVEKVSKKLKIPYVGTIWDDPTMWFREAGYDFISRKYLNKKFKSAIRNAYKLSTAGEAMHAEYKRIFHVDSVILRHGFKYSIKSSLQIAKNGIIRIGFAGSVYAKDSWYSFLDALSLINSSQMDLKFKVIVYGNDKFPINHTSVEIVNKGRNSLENVIQGISETDICYLPHWFDPGRRRHAELSFPNKFETYIAAGRPIIFHGPSYAGIVRTIEKYKVGICIHSLDPHDISKAVWDLIKEDYLIDEFSNNSLRAFTEEFNASVMHRNFKRLISIEEK